MTVFATACPDTTAEPAALLGCLITQHACSGHAPRVTPSYLVTDSVPYAGYVVGSDTKKTAPNKLQSLQATVNIADKWARVYLARLCGAILYAEWSSTQEFVKGQGKPFWTMLVLLATRCAPSHSCSTCVWLRHIRADTLHIRYQRSRYTAAGLSRCICTVLIVRPAKHLTGRWRSYWSTIQCLYLSGNSYTGIGLRRLHVRYLPISTK